MTQERASEKARNGPEYDEIVAGLAKPVVLIGMMGSGKTHFARILSDFLHFPAVDSDSEIENATGSTIEDYIDRHGMDDFRKGEERVIARLLDGERKIIATGGGAVLSNATRDLLKQKAITVWMQADVKILAARVGNGAKRPLLKNHDPLERLSEILNERAHLYTEAADFTLNADHDDADEMLREFCFKIKPHLQMRVQP